MSAGLGKLPLHELQGRLRRARTPKRFRELQEAIDARLRLLNAQTKNWPRLVHSLMAEENSFGRHK